MIWYMNSKILSIWTYIFNKATNLPGICCELQEFADAIFHLVREKYTELAGCSSLLHARHKGLTGIVMTRGMVSFQSACELFKKFNKGREAPLSLCVSSECGALNEIFSTLSPVKKQQTKMHIYQNRVKEMMKNRQKIFTGNEVLVFIL